MSNKQCSILIVLFSLFIVNCSSAPPVTLETSATRNMALGELNRANQAANRGRFEEALYIVQEAQRLAISVDDPSLRLRTSISLGDILFSLGHEDLAFSQWEGAAAEADASSEPVFAALAQIHTIRASLLSGRGTAASHKANLDLLFPSVRSDNSASAVWYIALGIAEKELENWSEAETAVRRALDIYERALRLEDAAYTWFLVASIRSLAGNYDEALDALRRSINIDRRVENGFGLASSWQAMGDVYQKVGRAEESDTAWRRAAQIYRAIGLNERAEKLENR